MFVQVIDNPVAVMFLSFIFGMIGNSLLRRLDVYQRFRNWYLFSGLKAYEMLGVLWFRKFLLATPLRLFNSEIRFSKNRSLETLDAIRQHMTGAEVAHWFGFVAMLALNFVAWWRRGFAMGLAFLILNVLGNLYPCLLQQYNRRRLAKVMDALQARSREEVS